MKIFWLLLLVFQNVRASLVTWDFGADSEDLTVVALKSGNIGLHKKLTQVSLPIPPCMNVKYVHVEVHNLMTTPAVSYNRDTFTVTIAYKLLTLLTWSHYDIVAKGKIKKSCGGGSTTRFPSKHQEPGSYYGHPPNGGHYDNNGQYVPPHQYPNHSGSGKYPNYGGAGNYPDSANQENYPDSGDHEYYPEYWIVSPYPINEGVNTHKPNGIHEHGYDPNPIKVPTDLPSTRLPHQITENPPHPQYPQQPKHPPDYDDVPQYQLNKDPMIPPFRPPDKFVPPIRLKEKLPELPPKHGGYYYNPLREHPNIIDDINPSSVPVDDLNLNMSYRDE